MARHSRPRPTLRSMKTRGHALTGNPIRCAIRRQCRPQRKNAGSTVTEFDDRVLRDRFNSSVVELGDCGAARTWARAVACSERSSTTQGVEPVRQAQREHPQPIESAPGQLGPAQRAADWQRLAGEQFDVVVIGGGVVGAGAALDAATRGLKVALVEARDLASGTSSRSSKLFHGGLRYLEQLEFGLVREALHERELSLTTLAPHLVKPLPFLFPLTHRWWERPYIAAGIFLYDQLGGAKSVPPQKHLTKAGALRLSPGLKRSSLIGGIRYY